MYSPSVGGAISLSVIYHLSVLGSIRLRLSFHQTRGRGTSTNIALPSQTHEPIADREKPYYLGCPRGCCQVSLPLFTVSRPRSCSTRHPLSEGRPPTTLKANTRAQVVLDIFLFLNSRSPRSCSPLPLHPVFPSLCKPLQAEQDRLCQPNNQLQPPLLRPRTPFANRQ